MHISRAIGFFPSVYSWPKPEDQRLNSLELKRGPWLNFKTLEAVIRASSAVIWGGGRACELKHLRHDHTADPSVDARDGLP
jgi:hypothetical protein